MTGLTQQTSARNLSTTLKDGTVISVNDHVYMASEFTGESYYIGRIMEFGKSVKGKPLQVRVGWFYRPKDVMARRNYDSRLLIATMHSDMNPVSSIRGRCTVLHQSYIKDLDAYKKLPDHFYYSQLFDRYIHRFYDVLPVESVRNLPPDVAEELGKRYQYIVVEAGTASEYTDAHRVCLICKRWCARTFHLQYHQLSNYSGEALKCIMCHGFHHMLCINPPMLRKPSKGFAFQCALCTKLSIESPSTVSTSKSSSVNNNNSGASSGQNSPRGSPKQTPIPTVTIVPTAIGQSNSQSNIRSNSRSASGSVSTTGASPSSQGERMSHMWPFRYFGTHADIRDIFESTESHSRAHSASLDTAQDGQETPATPSSPARSAVLEDAIHTERGGDDTATLLYSKPSSVSEEFIALYLDRVRKLENLPLPCHSADLIDKALGELQRSGFDADKALAEVAKANKQTFDLKDWSQSEIEAFEEGIRLYGHELFAIKKNVETRSMKDIVRFFYQWKKTERYQPVYSVFTNVNKPNKKFKSVGRREVTSPVLGAANRSKAPEHDSSVSDSILDFDAVILPSTDNFGKFECAHCGVSTSTAWRRAPGETDRLKMYPKVYCADCGQDWVRYVTLPPLDQKENGKKSKKEKEKEKDKDPAAKVQTAANGSGKSSPVATDTPVVAMKRKRADPKSIVGKKAKEQSSEPTRSPSPTPEIATASLPQLLTGLGTATPASTVSVQLVPLCARDAGYKIAFEMQPTRTVKAGIMVPMIWCPNHDLSARKVIQIRDQPDAQTDRTALQTYAHYYKQCDVSVPEAMRRCRLLLAMNPGIGGASSWSGSGSLSGRRVSHTGSGGLKAALSRHQPAQEELSCQLCRTTSSPIWWNDNKISAAAVVSSNAAFIERSTAAFVKMEQEASDIKEPLNSGLPVVCHACHWDNIAIR
ncbi:putative PHD type zinc finger protein with BAH domain-containing protein [Gryganskiella cystojenkinii]|nr:putative PHD type zinc finger protein with BAH domain-containing protein [Gryganskiella cystojenkinii]